MTQPHMNQTDLAFALESLWAREAIRDVLYRYCRGADRCDVEMMKASYHPDG